MNHKSTLVVLALLAALAAGAWWARSPSPPMAPASAARDASVPADDEALPDATLAAATVDAGGVGITLALSPNPPVAFAKTRVRVRAEAAPWPSRCCARSVPAAEDAGP